MTTDLWMLAGAVALTWVLILVAATPTILSNMKYAIGNRETAIERTGFASRAHNTAQNMKENLPLFTALVLLAHVSGEADATSALGSQIFLGARLLHAVVYYAGIPHVRTLLWAISCVGMGMIGASLF